MPDTTSSRISLKEYLRNRKATRQDNSHSLRGEEEIVIHESGMRSSASGYLQVPEHLTDDKLGEYFTVNSQYDGGSFMIRHEILVKYSSFVNNSFKWNFQEKSQMMVSIPFRSSIIEYVLDYLTKYYIENGGGQREIVPIAIQVKPRMAIELLMASDYLGIQELHDLICSMLAEHILDIPSFEMIPTQSLLTILSKVDPILLCECEMNTDFKRLNLDTSHLWKSHCLNHSEYNVSLDESTDYKHVFLEQYLGEQMALTYDICSFQMLMHVSKVTGSYLTTIHINIDLLDKICFNMQQVLSCFTQLTHLAIQGNFLKSTLLFISELCQGIISLKQLEHFSLTRSEISPLVLKQILHSLPDNLRHLDLSNNDFRHEGIVIADYLLNNGGSSLQSIDLSGNKLQRSGDNSSPDSRIISHRPINRILSSLKACTQLTALNLSDNDMFLNKLCPEGLQCLSQCTSITHLNLNYNPLFSSDNQPFFPMIWQCLSGMSRLSHLYLSTCNFKNRNMEEMARYLISNRGNHLVQLDLSGNMFTEECLPFLSQIIANHPLESLDISQNDIARENELEQLAMTMSQSGTLKRIMLNNLEKPTRKCLLRFLDTITLNCGDALESIEASNVFPIRTFRPEDVEEYVQKLQVVIARRKHLVIQL